MTQHNKFTPDSVDAVVFDYGNTLIEFGPRQVTAQNSALIDALREMFGNCDVERLAELRDRQLMAPYLNGYIEADLPGICRELIRFLYEEEPTVEQVERLVAVRYETFVRVVSLPDGVLPLLQKLARQYRLALVSNYPCGRSIRDSLTKIGLTELFECIVVSGEVGFVKPHPRPFETMIDELGLSPQRCVYVGDNWLADIQGAKKLGMGAVLTKQYQPYQSITPEPDDFSPDATIQHLDELLALFGVA